MSIKYYVINLDRSTDRLKSVTSQCEDQNINLERIPAYDGNTLDLKELADDAACRYEMGRSIQPGEVGCFLSHRKALEEFLLSGEEFAVILEDDATMSKNFSRAISDICLFIKRNSHINIFAINLGPSDYKYSTTLIRFDKVSLLRAHRFPILTTGIFWTKHGAETILKDKNKIKFPYDNYLRMLLTREHMGLSVNPPLISAADGKSVIDDTNTTTRRSYKNRSQLYFLKKQKRIIHEKLLAILSMLKWNINSLSINKDKESDN